MSTSSFPLEKIFGSRTRIKIITLFTTGVKRPYYVREIARTIDERLNAVRRELDILEKIGMLTTQDQKRRKYYTLNPSFPLTEELTSIMQKAGPGVEDELFQNLGQLGDISYLCVSGFFTGGSSSPTDILIIGAVNESELEDFISKLEDKLGRDVTYTPMTLNEYKYRLNFNDSFLRNIFAGNYKEVINELDSKLSPDNIGKRETSTLIRS